MRKFFKSITLIILLAFTVWTIALEEADAMPMMSMRSPNLFAVNIFVARLSEQTSSMSLQGLFEYYGTVDSARVVYDRETGASRRFGFVEMPNADEANAAISELDETDFEGRTIVVKEARPRREEGDRSSGSGGGYRSRRY